MPPDPGSPQAGMEGEAQVVKPLPPERDLYSEISSAPFPGGFPCQTIKPRHGVKYVTDEYCASFRRRAVCFDCGRGKRQERLKADASGIMDKIIKKEAGNMATKRGTCAHCEREDMALPAKGLCGNCYQKQQRGTLSPKAAKVVEVVPGEAERSKVIGEVTVKVNVDASEALKTLKNIEMAAENTRKALEGDPSWDDFEAVPAPALDRPCLASIGNMADRVCFNSTLQRALGWKKGDRVEVRLSRKSNALAIRLAPPEAEKAFTVTSGGKSSVLAVACKTALKVLEAQAGKYQVSVADWGLTVWLDRPEENKAA